MSNHKFAMKFSNLISAVTCALAWALLLPAPLLADSVSKLRLERSTDLQEWQVVPVTPEMLDANGEIILENHSSQEFFRMAVQVSQLPTFVSQPVSNTAIDEEDSATLSVNATGEGLSYQWYFGQSGDTSQPIDGATSSSYNTGALTEDATYWVRVTNAAGVKDSGSLAVIINRPPTITTQPISQTIASGDTATMTVEASGTAPLTYQWYRGNVGTTSAPVGTNSNSFTTPALTVNTRYWVKVSNGTGEAQSVLCTITIGVAPSITTQPASTSIDYGSTATLSVVASGTAPLTYQWYQGAVGTTTNPVGTNSASFTTPALTATTTYWVWVSNPAGEVNSALATVTVTAVTTPADMALIPAGSFTMGDSFDGDDVAPPVTVSVGAFYIGKYEVTKALWDEVRTWGLANGYSDLNSGEGKAVDHPVHTITWFDMVKWCNARSQKHGLTPVYTVSEAVMKTGSSVPTPNWSANGYRLPTEAEWEKAARGGVSGKRFPWGTDTISHSLANYYASAGYSYDSSGSVEDFHPTYRTGSTPYTSPVGSFSANAYGLHDMAGNVWEWCWDWYGASSYVNGAIDPRGAASGSVRVMRGGSCDGVAFNCRVAHRSGYWPSSTVSSVGFRVVRSSVP
jgi:formylglycine-generating enzyme required for sulfatase activity